jgi:hypothetical protein
MAEVPSPPTISGGLRNHDEAPTAKQSKYQSLFNKHVTAPHRDGKVYLNTVVLLVSWVNSDLNDKRDAKDGPDDKGELDIEVSNVGDLHDHTLTKPSA